MSKTKTKLKKGKVNSNHQLKSSTPLTGIPNNGDTSNNSSSVPTSPIKKKRPPSDPSNVKVFVRVRPKISRENDIEAPVVVEMKSDNLTTVLHNKSENSQDPKLFQFDNSLWSANPEDPHFKSQKDTYSIIGEDILDHTLEGFNTCILAYGQTGSGKSFTMMGEKNNKGIIPRICENLYTKISEYGQDKKVLIKVSYFEIYNEQVKDLLSAEKSHKPLKIRENPKTGPYVEQLTEFNIEVPEDFKRYMEIGNSNRTVAATKMNDQSSRSHAVFTIHLRTTEFNIDSSNVEDSVRETNSSLRLVDLAGSERVASTGSTGARMKEGTNINKSLTTLGRVILSLSDGISKPPYRDSALTWLLKENLGGNSKTAMIACISPCDYDETLSTLRYATLTKNVKLNAVINVDEINSKESNKELLRMKNEIEILKTSLDEAHKNDDLLHHITNLSRFFEERLTDQTHKYEIARNKLLISNEERYKYFSSLSSIVSAFNQKNMVDGEEIDNQYKLLADRSEKLSLDIADDLERFSLQC
ncbi:hypothetical protein WICMUC_003693 [Wickerhamomyces mucosus]|uniref:Kinesin-like protein n=1 Tax=Wickerhamomyces mucosus TaxID=1378264 RepID=A0A9P8PL14_9ASCO|nr:hypothetical protein WICMUC_003693 [Wickerhamomyces mucosus]